MQSSVEQDRRLRRRSAKLLVAEPSGYKHNRNTVQYNWIRLLSRRHTCLAGHMRYGSGLDGGGRKVKLMLKWRETRVREDERITNFDQSKQIYSMLSSSWPTCEST
jgi:hypothetical protein